MMWKPEDGEVDLSCSGDVDPRQLAPTIDYGPDTQFETVTWGKDADVWKATTYPLDTVEGEGHSPDIDALEEA